MLELADDLLPLLRAGRPVAVVTVSRVARSAPRGVGAAMAVTPDLRVIGAISGGCIEADAVALAAAVLADGRARRARFGFDDAAARAAGLACGGVIDVLAHRVAPDDAPAVAALERVVAGRATTIAITVDGASAGLVEILDRADPSTADGRFVTYRESGVLVTDAEDGAAPSERVVVSRAPRPRLVIAGAGEHARALCRVGAAAGFAVTVCDAWELLATRERFPEAAEVVTALPHEYLATLDPDALDGRSAVCVLTHDERLDIPALAVALRSSAGFVGAMGARSTVSHRDRMLRAVGVDEVTLARLHSPLGLDLGGSSPDEAAVSVLAEIVASRHGGSGRPLRDLDGPLHRRIDGDAGAVPASTSGTMPDAAASCMVPTAAPEG